MEQLFHSKEQLDTWLNQVLYTKQTESKYERNQIRLLNVTLPVHSQMHREELKQRLSALLTPVLPFLTFQSFCTFESSEEVLGNVQWYDADDLNGLFTKTPPELIFIDGSKEEIVWHVVQIQEHHKKDLNLEQIIKYLVMHYLLDQTEAISYVVTAKAVSLQAEGKPAVVYPCRETNCYVTLYRRYLSLQAELLRQQKKACIR